MEAETMDRENDIPSFSFWIVNAVVSGLAAQIVHGSHQMAKTGMLLPQNRVCAAAHFY